MRLKIHPENKCPACGRDASHRLHRGHWLRWIRPACALMKCRLCLTRYLVRRPPTD